MSKHEVTRSERPLTDIACEANDNGGVELLEAADFSARELQRMLRSRGAERAASPGRCEYAEPRGNRCLCPACQDYRRRNGARTH